jgi:hypothetical protein
MLHGRAAGAWLSCATFSVAAKHSKYHMSWKRLAMQMQAHTLFPTYCTSFSICRLFAFNLLAQLPQSKPIVPVNVDVFEITK